LRNAVRYLLIMVGMLLLLALAAPLLVSSDTLKQMLQENISVDDGRFFEADEFSWRLLPAPQISALNLRMGDAATKVHADAVTMEISLLALLQGRIEPSAIQMQGVEIQFDAVAGRSAEAQLHLERINGLIQAGGDALPLITDLKARLYGGELRFSGVISPQRGGSEIAGQVKTTGINLKPLLVDIGAEPLLTGSLSAELQLSGNLLPAIIQRGLHAKGPVRIGSGMMQFNGISAGYDLIRFNLNSQGGDHHLHQLQVASPLINAAGAVHVTSGTMLSGRLRTTGLLVSEMMLAGTVAKPALIPVESQPGQ